MWLILGILAIAAIIINLYLYTTGKDYKLAMATGLSFTALTLCAEQSLISHWVKAEDWVALLDVVPTMEKTLWILTIISILLNIAPILLEFKNKNSYLIEFIRIYNAKSIAPKSRFWDKIYIKLHIIHNMLKCIYMKGEVVLE